MGKDFSSAARRQPQSMELASARIGNDEGDEKD